MEACLRSRSFFSIPPRSSLPVVSFSSHSSFVSLFSSRFSSPTSVSVSTFLLFFVFVFYFIVWTLVGNLLRRMVHVKEFRIVMPLSLDEYQIAQMYTVMKMQQQNTTGSEGVEVLENRPFEDDLLGRGQYTSKIYHLQSKVPSWLTTFAPADALIMQEESWNAYPICKSVVKCPYFSKFTLTIETIHKADNGYTENVHGLSKEKLAARQVENIDIASITRDYWSYIIGSNCIDLSKFQSVRTGRGPLLRDWQDTCTTVMTAYKLVTVDAPYWGFGNRVEQALLAAERELFLESHRNCFAWIDEWYGMTIETMRELEVQSDYSLNEKLGRLSFTGRGEKVDSNERYLHS